MPKQLCPKCAHSFDDEGFKAVCGRDDWGCADEVELSDPESREAWKGLKLILNARMGTDQWKDLADSAGARKVMDDIMQDMDLDTRGQWLLNWSKRHIKETT